MMIMTTNCRGLEQTNIILVIRLLYSFNFSISIFINFFTCVDQIYYNINNNKSCSVPNYSYIKNTTTPTIGKRRKIEIITSYLFKRILIITDDVLKAVNEMKCIMQKSINSLDCKITVSNQETNQKLLVLDEKINKLTKEFIKLRNQLKTGPSVDCEHGLLPLFPLSTKEEFLKLETNSKNKDFADQLVSVC